MMDKLVTVARVARQDGEGGLAIVQDTDEERTEIYTQGKFRFEIFHHPGKFTDRNEIIEFVKDFDDATDIELIGKNGRIDIEFNDDLI
ncbi:hypothetical protein [Haloarchaeobius sp. HME9146]|uniref:hypothetical protein n=1 Tax=Haloarchaeobius sp. HME9146 TaxID=2978732 RepID=UPI0021BF5649|nr:hypothetical protein [Haloarchaeobius sp. HME9146]MCT9095268.1 hypothetical protein [Haloarchaeobius sp. HME9146]